MSRYAVILVSFLLSMQLYAKRSHNQEAAKESGVLCSREFSLSSGRSAMALYRLGYNCEQNGNYDAAYRWFRKSAGLGYPPAYRELALMVVSGQGVKEDKDLAFRLYLRATRPDNEHFFYDSGTGTRSYTTDELLKLRSRMSIGSLLEEARHKNSDVWIHLGDAYLHGRYGVKKEREKAFYWFHKAAGSGDRYGLIQLTKLCLGGVGTGRECQKAFIQNRELAERGDPEAQYLTGVRYYKEKRGGSYDAEAIKWFKRSADQNNSDAKYMLLMIYKVKESPKKSPESLQK